MAGEKTAAATVHVTGEDGFIVIFREGDVIPEPLASRVTNPAAFTTDEDENIVVPPASGTEGVDLTKGTGPDGTPAGDGTPATPPVAPADEPEGDKPYLERAYASLQQAAKGRGLKGDGTAEVLIARLEADDREKSQS